MVYIDAPDLTCWHKDFTESLYFMKGGLFLQCLIAIARAESLGTAVDNAQSVYPTDNYIANGISAGILEPTSPAETLISAAGSKQSQETASLAKETSKEAQETATLAKETPKETSPEVLPSATPSPVLNIMNHGAGGDLRGPSLRNNLLYFSVGRHGFGIGATCDDCGGSGCGSCVGSTGRSGCSDCDNISKDCGCGSPLGKYADGRKEELPCGHERPYDREPCAPYGESSEPPCGDTYDHSHERRPYLRVTPSLVVKDITATHTETGTSTHLSIATQLATRTVTDTILSTHTDVYHPVKTFTWVEQESAYEYPASTINADHVRRPEPTR